VVAAPLTYLGLHRWLGNYAYHIDLNPLIFLGAGGAVLFLALLTAGYQAFKVARANPVDTLRYE
jgi:putative ABC transport system permease protein